MPTLTRIRGRMTTSSGRNLVANYLNIVAYTVVGFVVQPFLLGALGPHLYGAWRTIQRTTEIAVAADGQAYQSLKWVIASNQAHSSPDENRRRVTATLYAGCLWLPVLSVVIVGALWSFPAFSRGLSSHELVLALWALGISCIPVLFGGALLIPDAVLIGVGQGYRSMAVNTTVFLLVSCLAIWVALSGGGIAGVAGAYASGTVLNGLVTGLLARKHIEWWGWARPGTELTLRLLRFGGWTQMWSVATRLMLSSDVLVIGALMGTVAVSQYSFTSYVLVAAAALGVMTTGAFTPQIGRVMGARDHALVRRLVSRVRRLNAAVATFIALGVVYFNETFVSLWAGEEQYLGDTTNLLCVLTFLQLAHLRSDGQIHDLTLQLRTKSLVGLGASVLAPLAAWALFTLEPGIDSILIGFLVGRGVAWVAIPCLLRRAAGGLGWPLALQAASIGTVLLGSFARTSLDGQWEAWLATWIVLCGVPGAMMLRAARV